MKGIPIIFSTPMVRALLDGRKTQTRRLRFKDGKPTRWHEVHEAIQAGKTVRLWVKETWGTIRLHDGKKPSQLIPEAAASPLGYKTYDSSRWYQTGCNGAAGRWRSPIHIPRWASRITLVDVGSKVERLQEISGEDAKAEGLSSVTKDGKIWKYGIPDRDGLPGTDDDGWEWQDWNRDPRLAFKHLWTSIHGPDAWEENPAVVALSFRVVESNINQMEGV